MVPLISRGLNFIARNFPYLVFKVPGCVQDVLSSIYYARNIDFNKYKAGDRIPFTMFLDNEVYNMYIRYLGKDDIKTKMVR